MTTPLPLPLDPHRRIRQPGPPVFPRVQAVAGQCRRVDVVLPAGAVLLDAIHAAMVAHRSESAVLELEGGGFGPFAYVIPALSVDGAQAAFYSETFRPPGVSALVDGRVTFGLRDGAPFLHCHAFWTEAGGLRGGHVLPTPETVIAAPIMARAWLLDGMAFEQHLDPETNFTLFGPVARPGSDGRSDGGSGVGTRCFGLRLRPNQDLCAALEAFCAEHGIARATLRGGVASIIGADFVDGTMVENFATEMFIRSGVIVAGKARLDVALVDYTGRLSAGVLRRGANPVLMTVEVVLEAS
jgi:predicted DNA-binding protein with PD1-like motif